MKHAVLIARLLLGIPLTVFGGMGLLTVMPDPHAAWESQDAFSPEARALILTMWDSGFLMLSVVVTHLAAGVLILVNRFVPLALLIHLPVSLQMVLFHLFLDPGTGAMAYFILVLNVFLIIMYRNSYRGLLGSKSSPIEN